MHISVPEKLIKLAVLVRRRSRRQNKLLHCLLSSPIVLHTHTHTHIHRLSSSFLPGLRPARRVDTHNQEEDGDGDTEAPDPGGE